MSCSNPDCRECHIQKNLGIALPPKEVPREQPIVKARREYSKSLANQSLTEYGDSLKAEPTETEIELAQYLGNLLICYIATRISDDRVYEDHHLILDVMDWLKCPEDVAISLILSIEPEVPGFTFFRTRPHNSLYEVDVLGSNGPHLPPRKS